MIDILLIIAVIVLVCAASLLIWITVDARADMKTYVSFMDDEDDYIEDLKNLNK